MMRSKDIKLSVYITVPQPRDTVVRHGKRSQFCWRFLSFLQSFQMNVRIMHQAKCSTVCILYISTFLQHTHTHRHLIFPSNTDSIISYLTFTLKPPIHFFILLIDIFEQAKKFMHSQNI